MELIPPDSPLAPWISVNPDRMGGQPVFRNTRVPIDVLFDHLREGDPLSVFLEDFEGVSREAAVAVLDLALRGLLAPLPDGVAMCRANIEAKKAQHGSQAA